MAFETSGAASESVPAVAGSVRSTDAGASLGPGVPSAHLGVPSSTSASTASASK